MAFEETKEQQQMYNYFRSCTYFFLIVEIIIRPIRFIVYSRSGDILCICQSLCDQLLILLLIRISLYLFNKRVLNFFFSRFETEIYRTKAIIAACDCHTLLSDPTVTEPEFFCSICQCKHIWINGVPCAITETFRFPKSGVEHLTFTEGCARSQPLYPVFLHQCFIEGAA